MKQCSVEGCNNKHYSKGYCSKHYNQYKKYGKILKRTKFDPNEILEHNDYAEIVLYDKNNEEFAKALIDLEDIDKVKEYKWCLNNTGYIHNRKNNIMLHRLIMDCPDDKVVDHINHNPLDNRKENLRICTPQQNNMNRSNRYNNTSGVKGVHWDKEYNKWRCQITINKKTIHLGRFNSIEEAIEVRKQAEIKYFGEYRSNDEDVS